MPHIVVDVSRQGYLGVLRRKQEQIGVSEGQECLPPQLPRLQIPTPRLACGRLQVA